MNSNPTTQTLGELLAYPNETIKRNAMSILKTLTKSKEYVKCFECNPQYPQNQGNKEI